MKIYWKREWQRAQRVASNVGRHQWVRWRHSVGTTPPIFANSFPKSGTYMLSRCLDLLPTIEPYHRGVWLAHAGRMRPTNRRKRLEAVPQGSYVSGHLPYLPEQVAVLQGLGFRPILILRDPRDIAISYYKFEMKYRWLPHYSYFNALPSDDERLRAQLAGDADYGLSPLTARFENYLGWLDDPACLVVKFEDLVGVQGGGSAERQLATVAAIAAHVGLSVTDEQLRQTAVKVFNSGSQTFRKGAIGEWRSQFKPEHEATFASTGGLDLLERLGYQ